jgi:N-acetylmuramoyl-L-alanine amidase-like protein
MMVAHRLHINAEGKLTGNANIEYNRPWPCVNSGPSLSPPMRGNIMHTNVGGWPGTVAVFNQKGFGASAHFEIGGKWTGNDGRIHQFMSTHVMGWHIMNGNGDWWGTEHEDGGKPGRRLTDKQKTASAQVLEALSAQGGGWGFPLQVTDKTDGHGYGVHFMGGQNWGGHSCPQNPDGSGPRKGQRTEIVRRAKILRKFGQYPAPVKERVKAALRLRKVQAD